jgi:class 3 adenylate cyclase/alpha-beta hydrolase superfamily lysophospholipase
MPGVDAATSYARTVDGTHVAYQVTGAGETDIVLLRAWVGDIEHEWQEPVLARMLRRLGSVGRLIRLDRRGMGMSDRVTHRRPPTLEERLDDVRAVMDAAGSRRAVIIGLGDGSSLAALFAATYPERTQGLILYEPILRWAGDSDYPWAPPPEEFAPAIERLRTKWGTRELAADWVARGAPSRIDDERFIEWLAEQQRRAGSKEDAVALAEIQRDTDVVGALSAIHVPTLVITRGGDGDDARGRYVADRIAGARLQVFDDPNHLMIAGDTDAVVRAMVDFVEQLGGTGSEPDDDRVLATLVFSDIVGSTAQATEMGDRAWAALMVRYHDNARRIVGDHRGRVVDTAGDGVFAAFDGPGRAIRCSGALLRDAESLGLGLRVGLHTGECELSGTSLRGIAVHIAARVGALAEPSEVLVTQTVKDLVSGGGFSFNDRGAHQLKGISDEWRLYAVELQS